MGVPNLILLFGFVLIAGLVAFWRRVQPVLAAMSQRKQP